MKKIALLLSVICFTTISHAQQTDFNTIRAETPGSQWRGKRVAFLGDSMTQAPRDTTQTVYWQYLAGWMGLDPLVYGVSGHQWTGILSQADKLLSDGEEVDAILIFAGTNDFNANLPIGEFFTETIRETNHNGETVMRRHRTPIETDSTFCGRINKALNFLKSNFPTQQIIILTPIHRGHALLGERNIQPEESYANGAGMFLDEYVEALKQASGHWSVPVIDLHALSGFYPAADSQAGYFRNPDRDRLHLSSSGNERLARVLMYGLLALPSTFVYE